jgi:hypothetical protein
MLLVVLFCKTLFLNPLVYKVLFIACFATSASVFSWPFLDQGGDMD